MLYVALQGDLSLTGLLRQLRKCGVEQWIYFGEDSAWRVRADAVLSPVFPRLSIADRLGEMSWELRQPYIDWVGELSQLNASLDWWASELAAKNPYYNLFLRICLLGVAQQIIAAGLESPTLMVCSTQALADEVVCCAEETGVPVCWLMDPRLQSSLRRAKAAGRRRIGKVYRRLLPYAGTLVAHMPPGRFVGRIQQSLRGHFAYRRRLLLDRGLMPADDFSGENTILLFTWVDGRNFTAEGQYIDPHLGPLGEMLREQGYRVAYVPRVLSTIVFDEAVAQLLQTDNRFFFPELFVDEHEWRVCQQRAERFCPEIPVASRVEGVPTYRLAQEQVEQYRFTLATTLTYEPLVANLYAHGVRPSHIVHNLEGHSWEQALTWSVRRYMPSTRVVGYENVIFTRMLLSMYPAYSEFGLRPLPDRVVTNGSLYRDVLLGEGWPSERVRVGCALRHNYLWELPRCSDDVESRVVDRTMRILVATGIGFGESVELVEKACRAFGGDPAYEVIVKCHPMVDMGWVKSQLGELVQYGNIRFVTRPINELLPAVQILLYTHTSVCYEAIQQGVFPVNVRAESFLNLDKLDPAPEVRWVATTPADLRQIVKNISQMSIEERRTWQRKAAEVVRAALAPVTPECVDAFLS